MTTIQSENLSQHVGEAAQTDGRDGGAFGPEWTMLHGLPLWFCRREAHGGRGVKRLGPEP
jgi:hypothetical protein